MFEVFYTDKNDKETGDLKDAVMVNLMGDTQGRIPVSQFANLPPVLPAMGMLVESLEELGWKKKKKPSALKAKLTALYARAVQFALLGVKFKPNPGEKPWKDGKYYRTIYGKRIGFTADEEIEGPIRNAKWQRDQDNMKPNEFFGDTRFGLIRDKYEQGWTVNDIMEKFTFKWDHLKIIPNKDQIKDKIREMADDIDAQDEVDPEEYTEMMNKSEKEKKLKELKGMSERMSPQEFFGDQEFGHLKYQLNDKSWTDEKLADYYMDEDSVRRWSLGGRIFESWTSEETGDHLEVDYLPERDVILKQIKKAREYYALHDAPAKKSTKLKSLKYGKGTARFEPYINNVMARIPQKDLKIAKRISIAKSRSRFGVGAHGHYTPRTTNIKVMISEKYPEDSENVFAHEIGHSVFHKKYTLKQRNEWVRRLKEEKVGHVTDYAGKYDSAKYRGEPTLETIASGLYWDETHSETYAYMHATKTFEKASKRGSRNRRVNKKNMEKAIKIWKEVFA